MAVISMGGSVIAGNDIDVKYITDFKKFMDTCEEKLYVVVGGGHTARMYIKAAQSLGWDQYTLDRIGIKATRLNAMLLLSGATCPNIPESVEEAVECARIYKNVVMGGTEPGHTTDGVALLLAERLRESYVINVTSVGGIYDKDPRVYKNAKLIERMSYEEAIAIVASKKMDAGLNIPMDILALKIAERSNIKIHIVGNDINEIKKVIMNDNFKGTTIG